MTTDVFPLPTIEKIKIPAFDILHAYDYFVTSLRQLLNCVFLFYDARCFLGKQGYEVQLVNLFR